MLRTRIVAASAATLLFVAAAVGAQSVPKDVSRADKHFKPRTVYDSFDKSTMTVVDAPRRRRIALHEDIRIPLFELQLAKIVNPGSAPEINFQVTYRGSTWLFIDPDSPLQFLVGDSVVSLALSYPPKHDVDSEGDIREVAQFSPTTEQLRFLGSVGGATMRVTGQRGKCDVRIDGYQLRMVLLFDQRSSALRAAIRSSDEACRLDKLLTHHA